MRNAYINAVFNKCIMRKSPSINEVSSEGEEGGPLSKLIYYISLYSK